jgi:hypothetical protein
MKLYKLYKEVIFEIENKGLLTESVSDDAINNAINNRYNVKFKYRDPEDNILRDRYVQVYVYGQMKNGNYAIRGYQIGGQSKTNKPSEWKLFRVDRMTNWEETNMRWYEPISMLDPSIGKYNNSGDNKWDFATRSVQATFSRIINQIKELKTKKNEPIKKLSTDKIKNNSEPTTKPIEKPISNNNNKPLNNTNNNNDIDKLSDSNQTQ